jgi:hypothetical protein
LPASAPRRFSIKLHRSDVVRGCNRAVVGRRSDVNVREEVTGAEGGFTIDRATLRAGNSNAERLRVWRENAAAGRGVRK